MTKRLGCLAGTVGLGALLSGCMGPMALKPMMEDSEAYSARYFQPDQVPASGRTVIAKPGSEPLGFKRLVAKGKVVPEHDKLEPNGIAVFENTLINDRNDGTVREIEQRTLNGLPLLVTHTLSYHGVSYLVVQRGLANRSTASPIQTLRSAQVWKSLADMQENTAYDFETSYGSGDPLMPSNKFERHCKSGTFRNAGELLAGTPGKVIELVCNDINASGVKTSEVRFAWLTQYNVALITKMTTLNSVLNFKYDSLTAQQ
jgi:hypothetical protein